MHRVLFFNDIRSPWGSNILSLPKVIIILKLCVCMYCSSIECGVETKQNWIQLYYVWVANFKLRIIRLSYPGTIPIVWTIEDTNIRMLQWFCSLCQQQLVPADLKLHYHILIVHYYGLASHDSTHGVLTPLPSRFGSTEAQATTRQQRRHPARPRKRSSPCPRRRGPVDRWI